MMHAVTRIVGQIQIDPDIPRTPASTASVQTMLQWFFGIAAAVAILVIVIASMQFALSRGNPDKAAQARNTIIYAAIGLAIAILSTAIVTFVLGNV